MRGSSLSCRTRRRLGLAGSVSGEGMDHDHGGAGDGTRGGDRSGNRQDGDGRTLYAATMASRFPFSVVHDQILWPPARHRMSTCTHVPWETSTSSWCSARACPPWRRPPVRTRAPPGCGREPRTTSPWRERPGRRTRSGRREPRCEASTAAFQEENLQDAAPHPGSPGSQWIKELNRICARRSLRGHAVSAGARGAYWGAWGSTHLGRGPECCPGARSAAAPPHP